MALMFPRLARNFAKNGYFPTDEVTLERALAALSPSTSPMRIIDPAAGEGVAIAECAHVLGSDLVTSYAVEFDHERAEHARTLADVTLRSDLYDTVISSQSFGLLWLNPPYGDRTKSDSTWNANRFNRRYVNVTEEVGRSGSKARLEKDFYKQALPLLQYDGVLVFIIPHYSLDKELVGWLTKDLTDIRCYAAPDQTFKQVVIFGRRIRRSDRGESAAVKPVRERLLLVGEDIAAAAVLPEVWQEAEKYLVPGAPKKPVEHFYRVEIEPVQFALEVERIGGLWESFQTTFSRRFVPPRRPAKQLSPWHLALSLAAGVISGVVKSDDGRILLVKGGTYKSKIRKAEAQVDEKGNVTETRIAIDTFVPQITAWDLTPGSHTYGEIIKIESVSSEKEPPATEGDKKDVSEDEVLSNDKPKDTLDEDQTDDLAELDLASKQVTDLVDCLLEWDKKKRLFELGRIVKTAGIEHENINAIHFLLRHASGDWGDLTPSDQALNRQAVKNGDDRIFSMYRLNEKENDSTSPDDKIYVITESDRSVTTVLFASEY